MMQERQMGGTGGAFGSKDPLASWLQISFGHFRWPRQRIPVPSPAKINDLGAERIRFRFVLLTKVNVGEELWTSEHCLWMESGCRCADSANHIT